MIALGIGVSTAAAAEKLDGRWAATTTQNGVTIPFRLDISGEGNSVVGTLYGHDKEFTTSGSLKDGKLELNFDHYLVAIIATVENGELDGRIESRRGGPSAEGAPTRGSGSAAAGAEPPARSGNPFHAKRYVALSAAAIPNVPSIDGIWEVAQESPKGRRLGG